MPPDPAKVREWAALIERKCSVKGGQGTGILSLVCQEHGRPILACEQEALRVALEALPILFDAWTEAGGENEFYRKLTAQHKLPLFESLAPTERGALRSEFRRKVGLR